MSKALQVQTTPSASDKIKVCIRVRPCNERENKAATNLSNKHGWRSSQNTMYQIHQSTGQVDSNSPYYTFDSIFDTNSCTEDVYNVMARDIVHSVVDGYNGTIFAYGQTSSGKTHTMKGTNDAPGIILRSISDAFRKISEAHDREFLVRVSYLEIYNENIMDLLQPSNENLKIHEDLTRGIFVGNLREECVCSVEQALYLLEQGEIRRHFGATGMNDKSSRSHTIFRLSVESRERLLDENQNQGAVRVSTLNLVDLAGSERVYHTQAEGVRLTEGGHINKSLLTLGTVISKLAEGKRGAHIPYRDSKLTRILQTALGGNSRTAIICTVTPAIMHVEETHSTLKFANRAKNITNDAHINEILNDKVIMGRMKKETDEWKDKCTELQQRIDNIEIERAMWEKEFICQQQINWQTHSQELEIHVSKRVETELDARFTTELERRISIVEDDAQIFKSQLEQERSEYGIELARIHAEMEEKMRQREQEWEKERECFKRREEELISKHNNEVKCLSSEMDEMESEYRTRCEELENEKNQLIIGHSSTEEEISKLHREIIKLKQENSDLKARYSRRISKEENSTACLREPLQSIDVNTQNRFGNPSA
jgi:centromeric protein E